MPAHVTEWTVVAETPRGAARRDQLGPFLRALLANAAAVAPSASYDADAETLAAQFHVFADTREEAALRGCFAFWGAVAAAGLAPTAEWLVHVARVDDAGAAEPFRVRAQLRRADLGAQ